MKIVMNKILAIIFLLLSTEAKGQLSQPDSDSVRVSYFFDKAIEYENFNQLDSALDYYLKILTLKPDHKSALVNAGSMFAEIGDYNKAFEYFSKLRSMDRNDFPPLSNFCYYKGLSGNFNEAILYGDTALIIAKDSMQIGIVLNNRGYAQLQLGNVEKASVDINRSLIYLPVNPYAHRNKALIYIAEKKFKDACKAMNDAKRLGGNMIVKELMSKYCN